MKAGEILQVRGLTGEKVKEPVKGTQNSEENHQRFSIFIVLFVIC